MSTTLRPVGSLAKEILPVEAYRSPLWHEARLRTVSASEIAVVLGISPYQSPFDLWWAKRLGDSGLPDNAAMSRGRRAEPLVLEDFSETHPELRLESFGLVQRIDRPWQVCTPDAVAFEAGASFVFDGAHGTVERDREPVAAVEAKTAGGNQYRDDGTREWGDEGTDEIPDHYRAQAIWQADILGVPGTYVPVWLGFDYRCYYVPHDEDDAAFMREQAQAFLASLEADTPPPVDGHKATTSRLKSLHPSVVDGAAEVPPAVVRQFQVARQLRDAAAERMSLAENRLRAAIGDFKEGHVDGSKVCSRSVYDVRASVREFPAYTVNKLTVSKPRTPRPRKATTTRKGSA